jgi:hypothetical protein
MTLTNETIHSILVLLYENSFAYHLYALYMFCSAGRMNK